MKTYLIPLMVSVIVMVVYFSISQPILQEQSLSKQCIIPYDVNFIERQAHSGPNDGKPHYTIEEKFSIHNTVPITYLKIDEHSPYLMIKVMPYSHGYVAMCDPLPNLQKMYDDDEVLNFAILVDDKEIEYKIVEDAIKLDVNNNTKIEIVGFVKTGTDSFSIPNDERDKKLAAGYKLYPGVGWVHPDDLGNQQPIYIDNPNNPEELILDIDSMQKIKEILDHCGPPKYQGFAYGLEYSNGTHHIDNNTCKWQKIK